MSWAIIATWPFALKGVEKASDIIKESGSALDAVEVVAKAVEADPDVDSVGFGGLPNIAGEVELDAAIMDGRDLSMGAVAGIKGFMHPISIARKVMEKTPYNVLVGRGAEEFAARMGFKNAVLITDKTRKIWEERISEIEKGQSPYEGHDTVGIVALDPKGDMACGTSTSGLFLKYRGRVGDSPLVGSGFYVDNTAGGAAATGMGEDIMKGCTCFYAVELMRQGYSPKDAAEEAVRRIHKRLAETKEHVGDISIVCMDNKGNWGAATNRPEFEFVFASDEVAPAVYKVTRVSGI